MIRILALVLVVFGISSIASADQRDTHLRRRLDEIGNSRPGVPGARDAMGRAQGAAKKTPETPRPQTQTQLQQGPCGSLFPAQNQYCQALYNVCRNNSNPRQELFAHQPMFTSQTGVFVEQQLVNRNHCSADQIREAKASLQTQQTFPQRGNLVPPLDATPLLPGQVAPRNIEENPSAIRADQ